MGSHYYLKRQMEVKRKQMVQSAYQNGFTSDETVRYSQELDHLLNIYRRVSGSHSENSADYEGTLGYVN
ncbi:aspartyl-phosphate phosphatase Spo0E family protein [Evansella sp. LMS18]|uniref:aspartyl-phosphate phosphatase Spo0E family protein n=1 Tax=Evansella sp. LMS18 TaxID=2924033 RepID=UPI0020D0EECC|nr:aspartyl-phosphate phosphatase Spo0E family protein [Evansella sp. LMS18]UTR09133.1 aspartyl-phosphate phosphatase Spo0E family protein [Evansella sp. LMS18]